MPGCFFPLKNVKLGIYMYKLFITIFVLVFILLPWPVLAEEENSTLSAKLKSGGSYELFWPLTAGKTMNDSLYFLKLWKEDIGGMFISDNAQKADYEVTLATKRILEAEKLLKEGKEDLTKKTLEKALSQLTLARGKFSKATKAGDDFRRTRVNIANQLLNLDAFLPMLASNNEGRFREEADRLTELTKKFLNDLK